jgi:carbon monoxide dehydrogenase subunit G
VKIDNEFTVGVPIDQAWTVLTDLVGIAPCLPGAMLTGVEGDVYKGKVKIKVGPVVSEYTGTAHFREQDEATHHAVIDAKGKDSRGNGNASAAIDARLRADGERTVVTVSTDLSITGKIAQFGSGMINEVSAKLLGQFADNLEAQLLAPQTPDALAEAGPDGSTSADAAPKPRSVAVEPEPLDLMAVAGASVYKRLIPVALGLVAAIVVLLRRRSH